MRPRSLWALGVAALATSTLPVTNAAAQTPPAEPDDPVESALAYAAASPAELGVTAGDVDDLVVTSAYTTTHNGVTHVNLNQRHAGLEVFGGRATVNIGADGEVVFAAGAFVRGLDDTVASASGATALDAVDAVTAAADGLDLAEPENLRVMRSGRTAARDTVLSGGGISDAPIPARRGWQPTAEGLRPAWQVTIDDSSSASLWNAAVDADTGELLSVADWTQHDPVDELANLTRAPRAAGAAATARPTPTNPVNDGSSYRVLAIPTESPNDGDRELVTNPADGIASPFGWHDTDGATGPEFSVTRGNNTHAYLEQDADNVPDFGDTDGGPSLTFDFPADLREHAQAYRDAAVTNLFYGCNVIHDVLYGYGFDEASGNFQANNYGRGGVQGDYVRCEVADGSGTNNANYSPTAGDGGTPRIQMFLWPGNQFGPQNQVVADGVGELGASWARFGPPATNAGVGGTIALVNDGSALPSEGCGPLVGFPAGAIALVDRGTCPFLQKVTNAEAAGAVAVVIADNVDVATPPILAGATSAAPPTIPAVSITRASGSALKGALPAAGTVRKNPNHPGIRDGDLENGIIFHEYGHGLSTRLTGGAGNPCLTGNEQAGEGWSDYVAITTLLDPALDDPEGPRGMGPYALFQDSREGNGIRPRPYSRNMTIQPFTYDSIRTGGWLDGTTLALPHGLGHGWATVLWDMNWDLIDKHGFNPNIYEEWDTGGNNRALQYVVDGLKFQGCGPGLVVARAAIVAAADELGGEDVCTLWATFSRRGLGFSAVQGTTNRNDNQEAFDTHPDCRRDFLSPVQGAYGALNDVDAGDAVPLRFTAGGARNLDILASNSPFSRRVDCTTLQVPSQGAAVTPRELPIATRSPGGSRLTVSSNGTYTYPWLTQADWEGTCREVVLTRDDGIQHRAFFRFV